MLNTKSIFYLGLICIIIIVIKQASMNNKSNIEKFEVTTSAKEPKTKDIIQKITGLRKSNIPYNNNDNKSNDVLILKDNNSFYKEHKKTLQISV